MMLHDGVGINCEKGPTTEAQMSSIWAKVCILMTVCVIWLDMTTPIATLWKEKVKVYYYYYYYYYYY